MLDSLVGRRFEIRQPSKAFPKDFRVVGVAGTVAWIKDVDDASHRVCVWSVLRALHQKTLHLSR
jgi:hypothetical protein